MNLPTLSNWRTWEPNPIVVKELRQAVRSWAITGMLLLFLSILFFVTVGFLLGQSFSVNANQALGREIFQFFLPVLSMVGFFFIPIYVGGRLTAERQDGNVDMLYITTLPPARIIRGKLLCGTYLIVLFFSVCAPFMVFTNLLRGIDLPTVFVLLAMAFLLSILSLQAAIFLSCLPASKGLKMIVGIPAGMFMMSLVGMMTAMSVELMREGIGSRLGTWDFWGPTLTMLFLGLLLFGFFHLAAIALISPPSANRALPLRSYVAAAWLLTLLVGLSWNIFSTTTDNFMQVWSGFVTGVLILSLLISISEGDEQSVRIRRTIPASGLKKTLAFFFYSGSAGGLAWTVALAAVTMIAATAVLDGGWLDTLVTLSKPARTTRHFTADDNFTRMLSTLFLYALAYSLFGLFIHRRFQSHRPPIFAAMCAAVLPAAWAIVPNLLLFFVGKLTWDSLQERQMGNIFNVVSLKDRVFLIDHQLCALALVAIAVTLNLSWFLRQFRAFQPAASASKPASTQPPVS